MKSSLSMTRRDAIKLLACAVPALWLSRGRAAESVASVEMPKILKGPFSGNGESLRAYRCPDWFRDAKLGMWAHWGPQSAPEDGDWYARNLYLQGTKQYKSHLERYGHPTKFGYKDIIPTWKGEQFDPEHLVGLYKKAGAKYFMSMGVHVDNFDMWDSKYQRWNAAKMGVKRNVVGEFRRAARRHGLKFGVSDHLWMAYKWMSVAHGSDKTGPLAGQPYDGIDPVLSPHQPDIRSFEQKTLYKSQIIHDPFNSLGWPFVMFYNGKFKNGYERIGMAVSRDMVNWIRYGAEPVVANGEAKTNGISGDPQLMKIGDVWVMFYFGAGWQPSAFDTFACSYDLVHWTKWTGANLIQPSEPFDKTYAHKPWVLKYKGVVYHFYCAVGTEGRTIALATSVDLKGSSQTIPTTKP